MESVPPAGESPGSSRLGYGCASLMARTGSRASRELLDAAFESGIAYFDVARSYGYGEAERVLGELARGRREELTIATKLGIAPPRRRHGLAIARAAARPLVRAVPSLRGVARRRAEGMATHGSFDLETARGSLEASLRELRTDHVDVLLLHECEPADVTPELLELLRERVVAGQVRRYGVATGVEAARAILAAHPDESLVAQVPFDVARGVEPPLETGAGDLVMHSTLAGLGRLHDLLISSDGDLERWSGELDADLSRPEELGGIMLGAALAASPGARMLFASRDVTRIRANARVEPLPAERMRSFTDLVRRFSPAETGLSR